jgi:pimeloyl-ACP methyl ester carboxylesterase
MVRAFAERGTMPAEYTSRYIAAQDGLKLYARVYGGPAAAHLPVVCLPGLARSSADFEELATALAADAERPRQVICMDYRGRGRSDYDRNPQNYSFTVELGDVLAVLTALDIGPAVFVGTSRGGILTMLLGAARPRAIAGVVLNDIGPVIEPRGLMRIKGYVGKLPSPKSYDEAADILRRLFGAHFPKLTPDDWLGWARRTFEERNGKLVPSYDPRLAGTLGGIDIERPLPSLWKEFDTLARVPVMVVRGANSDLLAAETVKAMQQRRPDLKVVEVPDQGHAPLLSGPDIIRRIADLAAGCDPTNRN